jgi:hypothetical protein
VAEDNFQRELYVAINKGCKAADLREFLFPLLNKRRELLIDKLERSDFYAGGVDNMELITIQLELKVIAAERDAILGAIDGGIEAEEKLRELNTPEKMPRPGIRLKF